MYSQRRGRVSRTVGIGSPWAALRGIFADRARRTTGLPLGALPTLFSRPQTTMNRPLTAVVFSSFRSVVSGLALVPAILAAQATVPEIRFDANIDPLTLPADRHFGEVVGVSMNSKRHVFVFTRTGERSTVHGATASQLFEFDQTGKFVREIGKDLYGFAFAHTVRVDKDDNI